MRYLTCYTPGDGRIDINNTWLGVEKVYYNGELVSSKPSFWGNTHIFEVREKGSMVQYTVRVQIKWPFRMGFDIFRNGIPLVLS